MPIDANGNYIRETPAQIEANMLSHLRSADAFGQNARVTPEDFLGMLYKAQAGLKNELEEQGESLFFSLNPYSAVGTSLDLVLFPFLRTPAQRASGQIKVTVTADSSARVFPRSTIFENEGNRYSSQDNITVSAGETEFTVDVLISYREAGLQGNRPAGTIFTMPTVPTGFELDSANLPTNEESFITGAERETDIEYRKRYTNSLLTSAEETTLDHALLALPNVLGARIYINNTNNPSDGTTPAGLPENIPAHGYEVVVRVESPTPQVDISIMSTIFRYLGVFNQSKATGTGVTEVRTVTNIGEFNGNYTRAVLAESGSNEHIFFPAPHYRTDRLAVRFFLTLRQSLYPNFNDDATAKNYAQEIYSILAPRLVSFLGGEYTDAGGFRVEGGRRTPFIGGSIFTAGLETLAFELDDFSVRGILDRTSLRFRYNNISYSSTSSNQNRFTLAYNEYPYIYAGLLIGAVTRRNVSGTGAYYDFEDSNVGLAITYRDG